MLCSHLRSLPVLKLPQPRVRDGKEEMKLKWLEDLERRAKDLPPKFFKLPEPEVKPGERVIGKASKEVQQLWALNAQLLTQTQAELGKHALRSVAGECSEDEDRAFSERITVMSEEGKAIMSLFWRSLRTEIGLEYGNIGVRGDFDVVTWEDKPFPSPQELVTAIQNLADALAKGSKKQ